MAQPTATFRGRPIAQAAATPLVAGVLDYAVSGDSIVKFADRMGMLADLSLDVTGGAGQRAIDFPPVRDGHVWLIQRLGRVASIGHSSSVWALMPPSKDRSFAGLSGILLAGDVPGHLYGGIPLVVGGTNGGGIEQTNGSAQIWTSGNLEVLTVPERWFLRYMANIGGTSSGHLAVYGAELQVSDLMPCP